MGHLCHQRCWIHLLQLRTPTATLLDSGLRTWHSANQFQHAHTPPTTAGCFTYPGVDVAKPSGDPALKTAEYQRNLQVVKARRNPCARCGKPIDYDGPSYLIINGRRRWNPWGFECGHIIDRVYGGSNALTNLQAEHRRCSRKAGSRLGHARRWGVKVQRSRRW